MTARVKRKAQEPKRPKLIRRGLKVYPPPVDPKVFEGTVVLPNTARQGTKEASWPRVYVSTSSSRPDVAREAIAYLKENECTITYDWTEDFEDAPSFSDEHLAKRAVADIKGCSTADFVVVIMTKEMGTAMTGSAIEIGAALARDVQVIMVLHEINFDHFFEHHPRIVGTADLTKALKLIRWSHRI